MLLRATWLRGVWRRYGAPDHRFLWLAGDPCEHEGREYLSECISNWSGVGQIWFVVASRGCLAGTKKPFSAQGGIRGSAENCEKCSLSDIRYMVDVEVVCMLSFADSNWLKGEGFKKLRCFGALLSILLAPFIIMGRRWRTWPKVLFPAEGPS